jgi:hypothetical protein
MRKYVVPVLLVFAAFAAAGHLAAQAAPSVAKSEATSGAKVEKNDEYPSR